MGREGWLAEEVERVNREMKVLRFEVGGGEVVRAVMSEEAGGRVGESEYVYKVVDSS